MKKSIAIACGIILTAALSNAYAGEKITATIMNSSNQTLYNESQCLHGTIPATIKPGQNITISATSDRNYGYCQYHYETDPNLTFEVNGSDRDYIMATYRCPDDGTCSWENDSYSKRYKIKHSQTKTPNGINTTYTIN